MKKISVIFVAVLLAGGFHGCKKECKLAPRTGYTIVGEGEDCEYKKDSPDNGDTGGGTTVTISSEVINGVTWATCNVDAPGTVAGKPSDYGMFYQWNRKKGWASTGETVSDWDNNTPSGSTWEKANDPSPAGWRVPTLDELESLLDEDKVSNEWTTLDGVNGRQFTDKATGKSIFFPATGYRDKSSSILYHQSIKGYYWSNTLNNNEKPLYLYFLVDNAQIYYDDGGFGHPIRCVAE
ncbi:MAG: fibrobacter succinogenes major paralogous domain-containing protein [Bacteroidales bacterium]|jgi:uncharacterized protein (TIGR02145 family)|nr:fibrobacter succinogenes major paralogous domain-containing protein [Bacteroidales bacterium]